MRIEQTPLAGLLLIMPKVHRDHRGFFMETWRDEWLPQVNPGNPFVQDNHARSETPGVMRGLHFQKPPHAQGKLICAIAGSIYDVAVDIRRGSPTYGQWFGAVLSAQNAHRLFVPRGFAHGYMTLEPGTEVQYKVDSYYNPEHEGGIRWNDKTLGITWPNDIPPVLSPKDEILPEFCKLTSPFSLE